MGVCLSAFRIRDECIIPCDVEEGVWILDVTFPKPVRKCRQDLSLSKVHELLRELSEQVLRSCRTKLSHTSIGYFYRLCLFTTHYP